MPNGMRLDYAAIISLFTSGQIGIKWVENSEEYQIYGFDGNFLVECYIQKGTADATDFEANYKPGGSSILNPLSPTTKRPETIVVEPEGDSISVVSHNFADKTTWYTGSIQVTGEILTLDTGLVYDFANPFVIDVTHGKVTGESAYKFDFNLFQPGDSIRSTYALKVYDDGSQLEEGTEYTMDYAAGKVTLLSPPVGPVTADYFYADGSEFYVKHNTFSTGTKVRFVEINFTSDIGFKPIVQEFQVYIGTPINGFVTADFSEFINIYNLIDIGNEGKGTIPQVDTMGSSMLVMPFIYGRSLDLKTATQGRIKITTKNDEAMTGSRATATFYTAAI